MSEPTLINVMARPATITLERIVEAARAVFMENGYADATTAAIARRAGVSEGSLFNRFKGKIDLFHAAMDLPHPAFLQGLPARVGQGDVRANLVTLAHEALAFFDHALPKMMMVLSNRALMPRAMPPDAPPIRAVRALAAYLGAEMERGRLRRAEPEIAARLLIGGLWHFCFVQAAGGGARPLPRDAFVRGFVDQLWSGFAPQAPARPRARARVRRAPRRAGRARP